MPKFDFHVHGKTYADRKNSVREKAMAFQDLFTDGVTLSWSDLYEFSCFFTEQARRYGLTDEFVENGII